MSTRTKSGVAPLGATLVSLGLASALGGCLASHGGEGGEGADQAGPLMNVAPALGLVCLVDGQGATACRRLASGSSTPVFAEPGGEVLLMPNAQSISGRNVHSCALTDDGAVYCWGDNAAAIGSPQRSDVPLRVWGLPPARSVSAGRDHSCAVAETGQVYCWGENGLGQLGLEVSPDNNQVFEPVRVDGLSDALVVSAGGSHACALVAGGRIACWGGNSGGQLGSAQPPEERSFVPVLIPELDAVRSLDTGSSHNCAITADRSVHCWGGNLGSEADRRVPAPVAGAEGVKTVALGRSHSCALHFDGSVSCWGDASAGQLGPGTQSFTRDAQPIDGLDGPDGVGGVGGVVGLSAGGDYTCARLAGGELRCWGGDYPDPVQFAGGS